MKTKEIVLDLLQRSKSLRDSDNRLQANVWSVEIKALGYVSLEEMSAVDLLKLIADGKLSAANNIKRIRCKLQQENEHLRGDKYDYKQRFVQDRWRKEMRKKEIYTFDDPKQWETKINFQCKDI
tara:strand:- start:1993 stop:2364 length:372 start_codon:yes stop_codon:yes gene_type:complete